MCNCFSDRCPCDNSKSKTTPERKPHVHADVIRAWADGHQIQFRHNGQMEWTSIGDYSPEWSLNTEYRIKPEPKPDVVQFHRIEVDETGYIVAKSRSKFHNLQLTFDGETGALKAAEVLK